MNQHIVISSNKDQREIGEIKDLLFKTLNPEQGMTMVIESATAIIDPAVAVTQWCEWDSVDEVGFHFHILKREKMGVTFV